jgi:electron transport complex protein RnfA
MDGGALLASLVALALANRLSLDSGAASAALPPLSRAVTPAPPVAAAASTPRQEASAPKPGPDATVTSTALPSQRANATPSSSLRELAVHGVLSALVVCVTIVAVWLAQQALAPLALLQSTAFLMLPLAAAATALTAVATTRWRPALRAAAWPLIAANAVAIAVLMPAATTSDLATALLRSFLAGAGFALVLLALATLDARLQPRVAPAAFRGLPLSLLNAGLLALAAQGLAGFVA